MTPERMALGAAGVLVLVLGWSTLSYRSQALEAEAAYERLAEEAKALLKEEREAAKEAVAKAEARGREAADRAITKARKSRGGVKKRGKAGRKRRSKDAPDEAKAPGSEFVHRLYDAADAVSLEADWDDATFEEVAVAFDEAFAALDLLMDDHDAGLSREDAKERSGVLRQALVARLTEVLGEEQVNAVLELSREGKEDKRRKGKERGSP